MDEHDHLFLVQQEGKFFLKKDKGFDVKGFVERTMKEKPVIPGGLITPKSRCCGAGLHLSKGGIRREICNKCGKPNPPPVRYC